MAYNGAEKGCSGTKEELVMELMALPDGDDAYLSGEKEFTIIRRFYVEYDRRACRPSIEGHPPEMPQPVKRYGRVCERWNQQRAYTLRYVGANARSKRRSGAMMRMVAADFSKHCQREEGDRNCVCMGSISRLRALHTLGRAYGAGYVRI